jgi:geranylgeranyl diphosphate synthase type 3
MDDVEDNSELRRGIPVAHTIYGVPQTINTANYVYFLAVQELLAIRESSKAPSPDPDDAQGDAKGKRKEVDLVAVVTGVYIEHALSRASTDSPTDIPRGVA